MKIIDMEHHFYTESFLNAVEKRTEAPCYNPSENNSLTLVECGGYKIAVTLSELIDQLTSMGERRIKDMDENGLTSAVLGSSPGPELIEGQEGISLVRDCNEQVYNMMKKYPGRFFGAATLPVSDVQESCKELERCVKEYGFVSWHTHSNYGKTSLDQEQYLPILQKAADLGVYVYLHPHNPNDQRLSRFGYMFSAAGLGFTIDTMITIMSMIVGGVFDKIPNLKVVLGHLGESLPFLMERMDSRFSVPLKTNANQNKEKISYYFQHNIMVTTSGNMSKAAFALTKEVLGIDNIMLGTDYPYESLPEMMKFLDELELTQEEREKLYYRNAERLMGI